jgi:putative NADH-flavin reductase
VNILVFGITGRTGHQVTTQALGQRHTVTALVRNPAGLSITDERLRVLTGDTTRDESAVAEAVRGQDLVVSALGRRNTFKSEHLIERSMRLIVPAMEAAGVRRFILVSAFGVGESRRDAPLIPRIMYRLLLRDIFADKKAGEDYVKKSSLDWTTVYPVLLTDGPLTGDYRAGERLELHGMPRISRADVAHFILTEARTGAFVRKTAAVSY